MKCVMFHFLVLCLLVLSGCAAPLPAMPAPATAEPPRSRDSAAICRPNDEST